MFCLLKCLPIIVFQPGTLLIHGRIVLVFLPQLRFPWHREGVRHFACREQHQGELNAVIHSLPSSPLPPASDAAHSPAACCLYRSPADRGVCIWLLVFVPRQIILQD